MNNKRTRLPSFLAGMLLMALVTALAGTALAVSGSVTYNQAGISLFGNIVVPAGSAFHAPNGQAVPSVITYVDEAGGKTNYLSVRQISDLLDADIAWNVETGNVDIAPLDNGEVIVTKGEDMPEPPTVPDYGAVAGPFTEIDPSTVDTSTRPLTQMQDTRMVSTTGCFAQGVFRAAGGNHIVFSATNNGATDQLLAVSRPITISNRGGEAFAEVKLAPGQTLTRAFFLEEDASFLQSTLDFTVRSVFTGGKSDVTLSLHQYE